MTTRNGRSLRPQRTSTKYDMLVPGSSTIAPSPFSTISRRAFSMRVRRSVSVIGTALPGNGLSARTEAGSGATCAINVADSIPLVASAAAVADEACTNVRRDMCIVTPFRALILLARGCLRI
jgi:hypothetical protein